MVNLNLEGLPQQLLPVAVGAEAAEENAEEDDQEALDESPLHEAEPRVFPVQAQLDEGRVDEPHVGEAEGAQLRKE